jgi:hypothetical protein
MTVPETPTRPTSLNDRVTTFLDALAMLAVAVGVGGAVYPAPFGWPLAVGGVVLGVLSLATQLAHRERKPRPRKVTTAPPGPSDPGNLHVMGG